MNDYDDYRAILLASATSPSPSPHTRKAWPWPWLWLPHGLTIWLGSAWVKCHHQAVSGPSAVGGRQEERMGEPGGGYMYLEL